MRYLLLIILTPGLNVFQPIAGQNVSSQSHFLLVSKYNSELARIELQRCVTGMLKWCLRRCCPKGMSLGYFEGGASCSEMAHSESSNFTLQSYTLTNKSLAVTTSKLLKQHEDFDIEYPDTGITFQDLNTEEYIKIEEYRAGDYCVEDTLRDQSLKVFQILLISHKKCKIPMSLGFLTNPLCLLFLGSLLIAVMIIGSRFFSNKHQSVLERKLKIQYTKPGSGSGSPDMI